MFTLNKPEFLMSILESTPAGIITCDTEGTINYINERFHEILGGSTISPGATKEMWIEGGLSLLHPAGKNFQVEELPLYRAFLKRETIFGIEASIPRKDGTFIHVLMNGNPVFNQNKEFLGAVVTILDHTEERLKRQELSKQNLRLQESVVERTSILQDLNIALGRSQSRFRTIVEQSPFGIQIFNTKGKTTLINPAWKKIFNLPEEFIQNYIMKEYNVLEDPLLEKIGTLELVRKAFKGEIVNLPEIFYNPRDAGFDFDGKWIESIMCT